MRKIQAFVLLFAVLFCGRANAQNPEFIQGKTTKLFSETNQFYSRLAAPDNDGCFILTETLKGWDLARFDKDLKKLATTSIAGKFKVHKLFVNDNSVDLLLSRTEKKDQVLFAAHYDRNTLKPIGEMKEILRNELTRKDDANIFFNYSRNQWFMCITNVVERKDQEAEISVSLLDSELKTIWKKDVNLSVVNDIFLSNDAEVIMMGYNKTNKEFVYEIITEESEQHFTSKAELYGDINLEILNFIDGKIIFGGRCNVGVSTRFLTKDILLYVTPTDYLFSGCYNTLTRQASQISKHKFTKEEVRSLCNYKPSIKEKFIETTPYGLEIRAIDGDENGNVMVFERTLDANIGFNRLQQQTTGMLTVNIDNNGQIRWVNIHTSPLWVNNGKVFIRYNALYKDGYTYVTLTENPKVELTDASKKNLPVYKYKPSGKPFFKLLILDKDGKETVKTLDNSSFMHPTLSYVDRENDVLYLLMSHGNLNQFCTIRP